MNEKKCEINLDEKNGELYGEIYFPLFDTVIEIDVISTIDKLKLEDGDIIIKFINNLKKTDKVFKDFMIGVSNFYNDYLTMELEGVPDLKYRAEDTNLNLNCTPEELLKIIKPRRIDMCKEKDNIALQISFSCPWEEEHDMCWLIYENETVFVGWNGLITPPWDEILKRGNYAPAYCPRIEQPYISAEIEKNFYDMREKYLEEKRIKEEERRRKQEKIEEKLKKQNNKPYKPPILLNIIFLSAIIGIIIQLPNLCKEYIHNLNIKKNPSTVVTEEIDKDCFSKIEKEYDDGGTKQKKVEICSAILKYEVNGVTYSTKRTEDVKYLPKKIYYNKNNPQDYYIIYDDSQLFYIIMSPIIVIGCIYMLLLINKKKKDNSTDTL